jgi:hypothetical protein
VPSGGAFATRGVDDDDSAAAEDDATDGPGVVPGRLALGQMGAAPTQVTNPRGTPSLCCACAFHFVLLLPDATLVYARSSQISNL